MKRVLWISMIMLVASLGFAGGQGEAAKGGGKAIINYYCPTWGEDFMKQIMTKYMEEKPGVIVNVVGGPAVWQDHVARTQLWFSTKYGGVDMMYQDDVFTLDGAAMGVLENLGPYMTQAMKDDLVDVQKDYEKMFGGIYRLPWWQGMSYNYYNKKMFSSAGLSVPKTWDELMAVGQKMTKDINGDGQTDQWGYVTQGYPSEMYINYAEFLYQAGGEEWTIFKGGKPDPIAKKALEFQKDLYQKYAPKDLPAIHYDQSRALLRESKAAILRDWGDSGLQAVKNNETDLIGVMNFPAGPAGPYGIAHCWGTVVNKYGDNFKKNKQAVIDFALFFTRPDIHKISAVLDLPALKSVYKDAAFMAEKNKANIVAPVSEEYLKFRKPRKMPAKHASEYMEGLGKIVITCTSGGSSVDNTLKEYQALVDQLTAK